MRKLVALLVAVGACSDNSAAPGGNPDAPAIDAPIVDAEGSDAPDGAAFDAACDEISDAGVCCERRRIYLNFDGVDLVRDPAANDARTGHTFLIPSDKTIPPFLNGMAGRDAIISGIMTQLASQLSGFDVALTRTRPGVGDYMMIVFGGDSSTILGQANIGAFGPLDCGNMSLDDLAMVFDTTNIVDAGNEAMFVLGISMGLSTTTQTGDCLSQSPPNTPCTLSASAPTASTGVCPNAPSTQNEPAAFAADLICR
jgi:hypothetical protein